MKLRFRPNFGYPFFDGLSSNAHPSVVSYKINDPLSLDMHVSRHLSKQGDLHETPISFIRHVSRTAIGSGVGRG